MRLVPPPDDKEVFEELPGGGSYNAGNRATHAEFCARALDYLASAGALLERGAHRIGLISVAAMVAAPSGQRHVVLAHGTFDDGPKAGMRRPDTLKKAGFDVVALRRWTDLPILVVTSNLPTGRVSRQLLEVLTDLADEVVAVEGDFAGFRRLQARFGGVATQLPPPEVVTADACPGQLNLLDLVEPNDA